MRPFGDLVSKEEALRRILAAAPRVPRTEVVPLLAARGRALAEDTRADADVPPFARATMDGYAVRAADGAAPRRVVGEAFAGRAFRGVLSAGEAVRIATGAPVPRGADAVVRVEDTTERDGHMTGHVTPRVGQSIDPAGADLARGALAVRAGAPLTPARLGVLASLGFAEARVVARPRARVLATGDELLRPGDAPRGDAIYDSNSTSLAALLDAAGAEVSVAERPLADDLAAHEQRLLEAAKAHDLVVLSGGASVGARDVAADAVKAHGELFVHGIRVKPGKPLLAGRVGKALVVGLPGNPTSALSNAALFVLPALRQMAGLDAETPRTRDATLASDVAGDPQRYLFLPVRVDREGRATPTFRGSGALTSLSESDGWVGLDEGVSLKSGTRVAVHLWP